MDSEEAQKSIKNLNNFFSLLLIHLLWNQKWELQSQNV